METGDFEEINLFPTDELLTLKCYKICRLLPLNNHTNDKILSIFCAKSAIA